MDDTLIRILALMKIDNVTETEIQELIGVPRGSFSNWKRNQGYSYYRYIDIIADRLGVTIDYLIRGHETVSGSMTNEENVLLHNYRKLTPRGKAVITENIELIIGSSNSADFENERVGRMAIEYHDGEGTAQQ